MKNWLKLFAVLISVAGSWSCNRDDTIIDVEPVNPPEPVYDLVVYEYTPAPGQFINESTGDMSAEEAAEWATERLKSESYVSLGAFGGYMIVGFGSPIGDFIIEGNAFTNASGSSNEPGIVYVMQDANGNGLPDDIWYELRGSESEAATTIKDYAVTYYRPDVPGMSVKWKDSLGEEGEIDYLASFHKQPYYYPSWIGEDSYTLRGTRLADNSGRNEFGQWYTYPLEWGYVDNTGSNDNRFHISDAMNSDGSAANLSEIDFIKIQTGVCGKCGVLGEISTEVVSVRLVED